MMEPPLSAAASFWWAAAATLLALVFLVLWLRARSGGGDSEARQQLRAAQNEVRLLKGDAIQSKRDHAAEVEKLTKELETLRAVAGGRVPPELEQWKQRAVEAEKRIEAERERHKAEVARISELVAAGGGSADQTMIAPGGVRDRMETLEQELAAARGKLEATKSRYEAELAALSERLSSEKAAALTAQSRRHAAELEALRRQLPGGAAAAAAARPVVDADALAAPSDVPDGARYPFLQGMAGVAKGERFYLPYDDATIGRSEASTVAIQEPMASRTHAEIRFDGAEFTVKDNNSTNGTLLNGELVASAPLNFGDVVGIGETQLRFTCEAFERASTDPAFAATAYEAMVKLAPNCRPALRGLEQVRGAGAAQPGPSAEATPAKSKRRGGASPRGDGGQSGEPRSEPPTAAS